MTNFSTENKMIQNLRIVFSHPDIVILTGIFFIIVFFIFPFKKYDYEITQRIILACCIWWMFIVFIYPPKGFNYKIYTYNASLTLNGQQAFGRTPSVPEGKYGVSPLNSRYLDYTGAQHLLYVVLEAINLSYLNQNLSGFGFQLWILLNAVTIILLINYMGDSNDESFNVHKICAIIIFTFCPVNLFYIIISSWEDKLIFLLLPLLLFFLIERKKYKLASLLIGITVSFNGLLILFIPIYLIFLFRKANSELWINLGLIISGAALAFIPFFPESFKGWINRVNRTDLSVPFWYSIYSFLPAGSYSPLINKLIIIFASLITYILYFSKRINLIDSLIISVFIIIILNPYNAISRVIPLILLLAYFTPDMKKYNWLILAASLFLYFLIDNGYMTPTVNTANIAVFYIPLLYSVLTYIYKRFIQQRSKSIPEISACQTG